MVEKHSADSNESTCVDASLRAKEAASAVAGAGAPARTARIGTGIFRLFLSVRCRDACGDGRRFGDETLGGRETRASAANEPIPAHIAQQRISFQQIALKTSMLIVPSVTMPSMMLETLAGNSARQMRLIERAGGLPQPD
jgi:hypothetical protein